MHIGKAIKIVREKRKISQTKLAKKIRVSQAFLSFIEKGLREPGFDLIKRISDSLQVPEHLLLLLACDKRVKSDEYTKYVEKITLALDDILQSLQPTSH